MNSNKEQPASNTKIRLWCAGHTDIVLTPNEMRIAQERLKAMRLSERQWQLVNPENR